VPEFDHIAGENISVEERKRRMLLNLSRTCLACSMCELGLECAEKNGLFRDPHVLSNMQISKFMVVGQNPGWDELKAREPFVGAAGNNFDTEIAKHGLSRKYFYICNTVRCWTKGNARPEHRHIERCEPFLKIEIGLLKPRLIITLGAVAFSQLCPGAIFGESLKKLTPSKYGVKVFPIYHPSPVNFRDGSRRSAFEDQIRVMCALVKKIG
jgi:DNA polymerase